MTEDLPPLSTNVLHTEPCPKCGSPDNVKVYDDGHKKCWSGGCKFFVPPEGYERRGHQAPRGDNHMTGEPPTREKLEIDKTAGLLQPGPSAFDDLPKRRIEGDTLRRFGIFRANYMGQEALVHPIYDQKGKLAYQKVRLPGKEFRLIPAQESPPKAHECMMQGQQHYGERFDKSVTVTVGEFDFLTLAQCLPKVGAHVSVVAGDDMAIKNMQANYRWLDRFETIYLWFDDDESGQRVVEQCAKLFKVGKVRLCKVPGYKDANAVLMDDKPGDVTAAYWGAVTWRPRGLVNARDCQEDVLDAKIAQRGYEFPWASLNEKTIGLLPGHVLYVVAGTGVGKTTWLYEVEYSLLQQGARIGVIGLEDMRRDVQLGLMTVHTSKRLALIPTTEEYRRSVHNEVFSSGNVILFDPETAEWSMDAILGYVRFLVKALDCDAVVLDPLSFVAAGLDLAAEERKVLDFISATLASLGKELGCRILVGHHLKRVSDGRGHEEGAKTSISQLRGSGGIANFASYVIGLERDQQAGDRDEDEEEGHDEPTADTFMRILKNRPTSWTGKIMTPLAYNLMTGRLIERTAMPDETRAERIVAQRQAEVNSKHRPGEEEF